MSDLATWKVRGPVRTLRTEFAEWDLRHVAWHLPRHSTVVTFHADGTISNREHHNPDGSVFRANYLYDDARRLVETQFRTDDGPMSKILHSYDTVGRPLRTVNVAQDGTLRDDEVYHYDDRGRKAKVQFIACANCLYGIDGSEQAYGAPGAVTMTVRYDEQDHAVDVVFHDANHLLLQRVVCTRDRAGRLVSEETQHPGESPFPGLQNLDGASQAERAQAIALFADVFGPDQTFFRTTYTYDQQGRLLERTRRTGTLGEARTTFRYDHHDNRIEETTHDASREIEVDEGGTVHTTAERVQRQHVRFDYQYDAHGNWTERVVWVRPELGLDDQPSNVERRTITYFTV